MDDFVSSTNLRISSVTISSVHIEALFHTIPTNIVNCHPVPRTWLRYTHSISLAGLTRPGPGFHTTSTSVHRHFGTKDSAP